jgi:hypothetical protein
MLWVGFESTTPLFELEKTVQALDRAPTVIGRSSFYTIYKQMKIRSSNVYNIFVKDAFGEPVASWSPPFLVCLSVKSVEPHWLPRMKYEWGKKTQLYRGVSLLSVRWRGKASFGNNGSDWHWVYTEALLFPTWDSATPGSRHVWSLCW